MRRKQFDQAWNKHVSRRGTRRKLSRKERDERELNALREAARPRKKRKAPWQWLESLRLANKRRSREVSERAAERLRLQQEWSAKLAMDDFWSKRDPS